MTINVTQKDTTLREIIDWCDQHHVTPVSSNDMYANGYNQAMENTAAHCRKHLGYSGVMPLEVPNQSEGTPMFDQLIDDALQDAYMRGREAEPCEEQVEAATRERSKHQIVFSIDGIRKCCSCGASVGGSWGDDHVAFERHVTTMMLEAARKAVM